MTLFKDYDWVALLERKLPQVPYLPTTIQPSDQAISFDDWVGHENERVPLTGMEGEVDFEEEQGMTLE